MTKFADLMTRLRLKVREAQLPPELEAKTSSMLEEAERLGAGSLATLPYFEQIANYVEWVTSLPWNKTTVDQLDLAQAQEILNHNHYGLQPVKDRILEYLAVLKLQTDKQDNENKLMRAPILCFVGLVGTGKTT